MIRVAVILLVLGTAALARAEVRGRVIFDALGHKDKPRLTGLGLTPIYLVSSSALWPAGDPRTEPNEDHCRAAARVAKRTGALTVFDVEHWPVDVRTHPPAEVETSLAKLVRMIEWARTEHPEIRIGFYGVYPLRDYYAPVLLDAANRRTGEAYWDANRPAYEAKFAEWQAANAVVARRLGPHVDAVFPSLYAVTNDDAGWKPYALGNLAEADRLGKPVHPFLWYRYHDSVKDVAKEKLSYDAFHAQLETCLAHSDGPVLWGGWQESFDFRDPWWEATMDVLAKHGFGDGVPAEVPENP